MKLRASVFAVVAMLLGSCGVEAPSGSVSVSIPPLESRADSVAARVIEASGGADALAALRYLRFDFVTSPTRPGRRHLWNRLTNDYRVEYDRGDTTIVVLFNTANRSGSAYIAGKQVPDDDEMVAGAYRAFINDMFWLLAPVKMLDPGVNRRWVADSSDAATDVLHLSFGDVGLTPGDQYWMWVDRSSGMVHRWAYVLQGNPTAQARAWDWMDYTDLATEAGTVRLSARKQGKSRAILTNALDAPEALGADWFTDPMPRL